MDPAIESIVPVDDGVVHPTNTRDKLVSSNHEIRAKEDWSIARREAKRTKATHGLPGCIVVGVQLLSDLVRRFKNRQILAVALCY